MPIITRKTISETFLERVRMTPSAIGFQYKPTYPEVGPVGEWKEVTFKEFYNECRLVSFGLMALGMKPQDKIVILSQTRFEWSLCDMAILGASATTVPIYSSNTLEDVAYIIQHSEARCIFLENAQQLKKILEGLKAKPDCLPHLEKAIVIEPAAMGLLTKYGLPFGKNVMTLQALKEIGKREEAKDPTRFDRNLSTAKPEDLATICYTSGTTGVPKGAMLTHENFMSELEDSLSELGRFLSFDQEEVVLSFLPFSHILAKVESFTVYPLGWRQAFAENIDSLMANIAEVRPTVLFSVPRIFEKAYGRVHGMVETGSPAKKAIFNWAFDAGKRYYASIWKRKTPSLRDTIEYKIAEAVVFKKVAQRFGGRLKFSVCGGAPLPREIGEFFQIVGIQILEGYGLTETTAAISVNLPDDVRFGAVGRPLPEVTFKIAEDGEILVKSKKVFKGYYKMPEETAQTLKDGWFHTGDIGHIDSDGFLHITDRKKDIIVTSSGKNIAPQKIENIAKSQKLINQFVVHGDRRNYLTALMTLDHDQIVQYANTNQILFSEYAELIKNPKILALAQKMIDDINGQLASFERIKKFAILPNEFSIEGGELTPSLKIRRNVINKKFKAELDSMYGDSSRVPLNADF